MAVALPPRKSLQLVSHKGGWCIIVPWDRADHLHARLKRDGYGSTLCVDPADHDARLELWTGVDPTKALTALESQ